VTQSDGVSAAGATKAEQVLALIASLSNLHPPDRDVDYLTHSLQAASRAAAAGASNELVVAALCHDLGHLIPTGNHAQIAADLLDGHVAPTVVEIVANHTSIALSPDRAAWAGRPWLSDAIRFVEEWDRPAFDPDSTQPPLASYAERVRRVFGVRREHRPLGFDTLLGGTPITEFIEDRFGQRPFTSKVPADRFDSLLNLAETERLILQHHRDRAELDGAGRFRERVRLDRRSGAVASELYHQPLELPSGDLMLLDLDRMSTLLNEGSRVTVHAVDELDESRAHLTGNVAHELDRRASMRAVATWSPGTQDLLRLPQHQFVLQLAGIRVWELQSTEVAGPTPSEHRLGPGDLLYVPAGWRAGWTDRDTPSLHLVIDVAAAPASDIFGTLEPLLTDLDVFREDLPVNASPDAQAVHAERLRAALLSVLNGQPR